MKSTYSQLEYARYERQRSRLLYIYSRHIYFKTTHADLLKSMSEFWSSDQVKRLSDIRRSMLTEVRRFQSDRVNQLLSWRLGDINGPIAEGMDGDHDWTTGRLSDLARNPGHLYGSHYWTGTDRIFGEWKCTNE